MNDILFIASGAALGFVFFHATFWLVKKVGRWLLAKWVTPK